jgi:hypothetical protein
MKLIILLAAFSLIANAQSPVSPALPMNVQTLTVPASTPSTTLNLTVDASPKRRRFYRRSLTKLRGPDLINFARWGSGNASQREWPRFHGRSTIE